MLGQREIDEQRGRTVAITRGVEVIGSFRVLAESKDMAFIPVVRPIIDELRAIRY